MLIDIDSQANLTTAMVPNDRISELNNASRTIYHLFLGALTGGTNLVNVIARPPLIVSNVTRGLSSDRAKLDMVISVPDLAQIDEDMLSMWEKGEPVLPRDFGMSLEKPWNPQFTSTTS